jgi:hypothetical protein
MQKCKVYHTGVYEFEEAAIKDDKVYICGKRGKLYYPEEMFMAREECEGGLIQLNVDGKWGFADIYSGEIKIKPAWDFAAPFYRGYAHVAIGTDIEEYSPGRFSLSGGKHGYIDNFGNEIIPVVYDDAETVPYRNNFIVSKNGKWGVIDEENKIIIPFEYDFLRTNYENDLVFCGIRKLPKVIDESQSYKWNYGVKWGVYDKEFNLIVKPELDEIPEIYKIKSGTKRSWVYHHTKYYYIKRKRKYGVLCADGRLITDISLLKRDAVFLISKLT